MHEIEIKSRHESHKMSRDSHANYAISCLLISQYKKAFLSKFNDSLSAWVDWHSTWINVYVIKRVWEVWCLSRDLCEVMQTQLNFYYDGKVHWHFCASFWEAKILDSTWNLNHKIRTSHLLIHYLKREKKPQLMLKNVCGIINSSSRFIEFSYSSFIVSEFNF